MIFYCLPTIFKPESRYWPHCLIQRVGAPASFVVGIYKCMNYFFFFICFWRTSGSFFVIFSSVAAEVSPQPRAIPGGNPPGDWQSAVGWGDARYEPGTAGQQSGALPLSHHHTSQMYELCAETLGCCFTKRVETPCIV